MFLPIRLGSFLAGVLCLWLFAACATAAGLYNDAEARAASLGGETSAETGSALAAMDSNPAALASILRPVAVVTITGALLRGDFSQPYRSSSLRNGDGFIASGAFAVPAPRAWPIRFGLAVLPDLSLESSWRYLDVAGGLGGTTSYGKQDNRSRILSVRTTAGAAVQVTRWLAFGAAAGFVYNQNSHHAPYIFQSQPVLAGFKTLLDLQTMDMRRRLISGRRFARWKSRSCLAMAATRHAKSRNQRAPRRRILADFLDPERASYPTHQRSGVLENPIIQA